MVRLRSERQDAGALFRRESADGSVIIELGVATTEPASAYIEFGGQRLNLPVNQAWELLTAFKKFGAEASDSR